MLWWPHRHDESGENIVTSTVYKMGVLHRVDRMPNTAVGNPVWQLWVHLDHERVHADGTRDNEWTVTTDDDALCAYDIHHLLAPENDGALLGFTLENGYLTTVRRVDGKPYRPASPTVRYGVTASVETSDGRWEGSLQLPYFELNAEVQGITDEEHAASVAGSVIDPLGLYGEAVHITAVRL
jgi:hypothetical protein